ncbi:beta-1,2-xylosyltransferase XYXT1-like [Curcuma longa]|uniref:beta-1,2-xylosyltransferase XYXT1-like n=1 Tax=Curcuma longa TaxID=136217 RepID=UPI003D9FAA96
MGLEKAVVRNLSRIEARRLGLALLVGCCLVILIYLVSMSETTVDEQAISTFKIGTNQEAEGKISQVKPEKEKKAEEQLNKSFSTDSHMSLEENSSEPKKPGDKTLFPKKETTQVIEMPKPQLTGSICDFSNFRTEFCDLTGDVRIYGKKKAASAAVVLVSPHRKAEEYMVVPYVRKHMGNIEKVAVRTATAAPACTVNSTVPAIVFALGGFTGNYYHDFTDVLLPLFLTAHEFHGEVQFLITGIRLWWLNKYRPIIDRLTRYEFVDLDNSDDVHCRPHALVDLRFHNDLTIDRARAPNGISMLDFTRFLREAYALPRERAVSLRAHPELRPRLLLVARNGTRRFTNVPEIVRAAEAVGFEVVIADANFVNVAAFAEVVNSCDVIMGVHGAGLTNLVFLPVNAVAIQIAPCCDLEGMAEHTYGPPARESGLLYLQYNISVEESTLLELYSREHPVISDPQSIHHQGWFKMGKIYLKQQNVKLDVDRFRPTLIKAMDHLRQ